MKNSYLKAIKTIKISSLIKFIDSIKWKNMEQITIIIITLVVFSNTSETFIKMFLKCLDKP